MSALVAGFLGAVGAYFLVRHVARRIKIGEGDGTLEFAPFVNRLGVMQLIALAWLARSLFFTQSTLPGPMQWAGLLALAASTVFF